MVELICKLVVFMPLIGGIVNGVYCKKLSVKSASFIAVSSMLVSAAGAAYLFAVAGIGKLVQHVVIAKWLKVDSVQIDWAIYVDQLTAIMFLLVSFVSLVVHIYSLGYMATDRNLPKFLSYLSLFTFFMLSLVSADNFLQLFFGWEGVGLCSYLLIGYYYHKKEANDAAIKAFIVNRVGDFAFIIGIVLMLIYASSIEFETVFEQSQELAKMTITVFGYQFVVLDVICLMLFLGCMGKSAQIGMHVWLPDAMEGPTPVSALIHAATMVTAGVFLVARCSFMFENAPYILAIIAVVGAVTCLFAATIAISQTDIKKIIAYSTCSQLGYMFFACGVSAYQVGIFHLVTHGFFKALLFLSAGSVIHAADEQDIFKMGGLRSKMPFTYANFWMGSLAIIGIFPFAGFYSKDLILESAYTAASPIGEFAFALGILAALLTAIYSMKIIILTFHGTTRLSHAVFAHAHEAPAIMNLPLSILIAGTLFAGMLGFYILQIHHPAGYFAGSIFNLHLHEAEHNIPEIIKQLPLIIGIIGSVVGIVVYCNNLHQKVASLFSYVYCLFKNKYFFDEIYALIFVKPVKFLSKWSGVFDYKVIDRFGPSGVSFATKVFSWVICQVQTGYIVNYAIYIILSIVVWLTVFIFKYLPLVWSA